MKVEIISGNEAGMVKDLPQIEAEVAIQTGYAKPHAEADPEIEAAFEKLGEPNAADLDAVAEEQKAAEATSGRRRKKASEAQ